MSRTCARSPRSSNGCATTSGRRAATVSAAGGSLSAAGGSVSGGARARRLPAAAGRASQPWDEGLAAQRAGDQVNRARRGDQPLTLGLIRGQDCRKAGWRQIVAKLGPGGPIALPSAFDARGEMVPSERRQRHRMPDQYAVQPVIRRHHVEQPVHCRLLEPGRTRRMHAVRPPGGYERCWHKLSIALIEHSIYILNLPWIMGVPG